MADSHDPEKLPKADPSRREFLKKFLVAGFAAPVVVSFGLDSVASASQMFPNQARVRLPYQAYGNQNPNALHRGNRPPFE